MQHGLSMKASAQLYSDRSAMHALNRCTNRLFTKLAHVRRSDLLNSTAPYTLLAGGRSQLSSMPSQAAASQAVEGQHKHTNRLAKEQSPYLLQHAHNPVSNT